MTRVVFVHGGAGRWSRVKDLKRYEQALREAAEEGYKELLNGSALDAVEASIRYLEDTGLFNAGKGSVLNFNGFIEMDAGIMFSKDLKVGSVACVRNVKNPISLARKIMEIDGHIFLAGDTTTKLARAFNLEELKEATEDRRRRYIELKKMFEESGKLPYKVLENSIRCYLKAQAHETVGAVALDSDGNLAAGASTGGIWLKLPGRIGDSPVPGAGFYADVYGAVSATGIGEVILRTCACIRACTLMALGLNAEDAVRSVVNYVTGIFGKDNIGMVAVDSKGRIGCAYNTEGMARAYMKDGISEPVVKILP